MTRSAYEPEDKWWWTSCLLNPLSAARFTRAERNAAITLVFTTGIIWITLLVPEMWVLEACGINDFIAAEVALLTCPILSAILARRLWMLISPEVMRAGAEANAERMREETRKQNGAP